MKAWIDWLSGKKAYGVALVAAGLAFCDSLGWDVPEWVYLLIAAAGLAANRAATAKVARQIKDLGGPLGCILLMILQAGCAQNQEQPIAQTQTTSGPTTPSTTTVNVYVAGGHQSQKGWVATTQPTRLIGVGGAGAGGATGRPADSLASAESGEAMSGGATAGAGVVFAPVWIDLSSSTEARSGSVSPRTGSVSPRQQGDQRPETQVNPSVPIAVGAMPAASAANTSAWKGPATSGPQSFDQSGARNFLKAFGLNDQESEAIIEKFLRMLGVAPTGETPQPE